MLVAKLIVFTFRMYASLSFCVACFVKTWVGEFRNIHDMWLNLWPIFICTIVYYNMVDKEC